MTTPKPRKPKEQIAAEKAHRLEMFLAIRQAIEGGETRLNMHTDDYSPPSPNKLSQYQAINSIEGQSNVARRTAMLTAVPRLFTGSVGYRRTF